MGASVEQTLSRLSHLRGMGAATIAPELEKHLASKVNLVVAKAAEIARASGAAQLAPTMVVAFWRFMKDPAKTDKTCTAKEAIAQGLYEFGASAEEVFLAGIRHQQLEGGYGRPVDTAAGLRGWCAMGLVRMGYRGVMDELVELMVDREPSARIMAARALAYCGQDSAALLLRLKARLGDIEPAVVGECLLALAALSGAKAVDFIAPYLSGWGETIESLAALALGEMRRVEGFEALRAHWMARPLESSRAMLIVPMSLSRLGQAIDFLIDVIKDGTEGLAVRAVEAMKIYRGDAGVRGRIVAAIQARGSEKTRAAGEVFFQ